MPVPFTDVTAAMKMNGERTETALQKVTVAGLFLLCYPHNFDSK